MINKRVLTYLSGLLGVWFLFSGCFTQNKISLLGSFPQPLKEVELSGSGQYKIAQITINGTISFNSPACIGKCNSSVVASTVAKLRLASKSPKIKGVVLVFDTPGGSVTASDVLYNEILRFKQKTHKPVVVYMRGLCASGGVYAAMAADAIIAHPTTITGSIGVIFEYANLVGLMDKTGIHFNTVVSGKHKDMGSPFRQPTDEEKKMFRNMVMNLFGRFVDVVAKGRGLQKDNVLQFADGRVFTADEALSIGLIDGIGTLYDAWNRVEELANLKRNSTTLISWRSYESYDETPYGPASLFGGYSLLNKNADMFKSVMQAMSPGFYYLWIPMPAKAY